MRELNKIFVYNAGCWTRAMDANKIIKFFTINRCYFVDDYKTSDYILLVTCGVTKSAQSHSMDLLRKFKDTKGELIVLGCLPGISPDTIEKEFHGKVLVTSKMEEIDKFFPDFKVKYKDVSDSNIPFYNVPIDLEYKNYGKKDDNKIEDTLVIDLKSQENIGCIRISHGCLGNCTYCAIKSATGNLKSKPLNLLLKEYQNLLDNGTRKFLITAEDCGNYGKDINISLDILFDQFSALDCELDTKWSIASLSPDCLIEFKDKISEMVQKGKITSIECDLQSGNKDILKLMNRYGNLDKVLEAIKELKIINPDIHIHSQFIVGFPTETEKQFEDSLDIGLKLNADVLEFFAYSDLESAPSFKMNGKIDQEEIVNRLERVKSFFDSKGYYYSWNLNGIFIANKSCVTVNQLFNKK